MKFVRIVFWITGAWGLLILTPLYFFFDTIGRKTPPPTAHPFLYYGFVGAALAWQVAFFAIGGDPGRFRPRMISAPSWRSFSMAFRSPVLNLDRRTPRNEMAGLFDLVFGVLFIISFPEIEAA